MKGRMVGVVGAILLVGALAVGTVGSASAWGPFGGGRGGGFGGMMGGSGYSAGSATPTTYGPGSGYGYGPGTMDGGYSRGYGPGMMGAGYGYGPGGMMGGRGQVNPNQPAISLDQAQKDAQSYVDKYGNADLTLDEMMEFQGNFYAIVKEKSTGIGAFEVLINKWTGAVTWEPQSMMWNTKYGSMSQGSPMGYTHPTGAMTVSAEQAKQIAQKWLDQYQPGSAPETTPDSFYGYYTMHTMKNGQVTGMLSINGYTGQVWYHSWHGAFVQMKSLSD